MPGETPVAAKRPESRGHRALGPDRYAKAALNPGASPDMRNGYAPVTGEDHGRPSHPGAPEVAASCLRSALYGSLNAATQKRSWSGTTPGAGGERWHGTAKS